MLQSILLYGGIAVAVIVILIIFFALFWKSPHADEAIQVTGLKSRTLLGKGSFVIPGVEKICAISLESIPLEVSVKESTSLGGLLVDVNGTAMVKVASNPECVGIAVEQFCQGGQEQTTQKIVTSVTRVLIGQLRAIVATMTIDSIIADMETFQDKVKQGTYEDIAKMGLELISYTVSSVKTPDSHYLENKAKLQEATSKAEADIATAEKQRDTEIKTSVARKEGEKAKLSADTEIAEAAKDKKLKTELYRGLEAEAERKAEAAGTLEQIRQKEVIAKQNEQLALQQAITTEKELIAAVIKPAEAEKQKQIVEAQAVAEKNVIEAKAIAEAEIAKAEAKAKAIKLQGDAEADVIKAKGIAEAEAMKMKADAYKKYGQAAILDIIAEKLPDISANIAKPLSAIDKVTVVGGGENISKMSKAVIEGTTNVLDIVKTTTGLDVADLLHDFINKSDNNEANVESEEEE